MPSAAIRSFAYDADRNELTVIFTNGRGYVYSLVPPAVFAALSAAPSKGAHVNANIRDRYPFRKTSAKILSLEGALRGSVDSEDT